MHGYLHMGKNNTLKITSIIKPLHLPFFYNNFLMRYKILQESSLYIMYNKLLFYLLIIYDILK